MSFNWINGINTAAEMLVWLCLTLLLLAVYSLLWLKKPKGGAPVLYGLALVPAVLFLMNGVLLHHPALIAASLVFGAFHFITVRENA